MNRLLPAFAAALALFAAATTRAADEPTIGATVPAGFVKHATDGGASLRTPADWHSLPPTTPRMKLFLAAPGPPSRNVNFSVLDAPPSETLETHLAEVATLFRVNLREFNVLTRRVVRIGDHRVAELAYEGLNAKNMRVAAVQFAWIENGKGYALACATTKQAYAAARPTFEQIAASVTLPAPAAPIAAAPAEAAPTTAPADVALVARAIGTRGASVAVPPDWAVLDDAHDDAVATLMSPDKQSALVIGVADAAATNDSPEAMRDAAQAKYGDALSVVGEDDVLVGDRAMRRLTYDVAGKPLRYVEYGFVDRGSRGRLTLFAPRQRFEVLRPTFERIAASVVLPDRVAELARIPTLNATAPADFVAHAAGALSLRTPAAWKVASPAPVPDTTLAMTTGLKDTLFAVRVGPRADGQTAESTRDALPGVFAQHAPNFRLISADVVRLPAGPAARIVFEFDVGAARARTVTFAIGVGDAEYEMATIAPAASFDALLPTVEQVMASAQFVPAPAHVAAPPPVSPAPPVSPVRPVVVAPAKPEAAADAGPFEPKWQQTDRPATPLLAAMTGPGTRAADGTLALTRGQREVTPTKFAPPVTFRIVARTHGNDVRLGYGFRQMIFNWEMRPTELRVDGGPVSGKHKPGAGALPADRWTAIELVVTRGEVAVFVDGVERYRMPGDFSKVDAPFDVESHVGETLVRSLDVVR